MFCTANQRNAPSRNAMIVGTNARVLTNTAITTNAASSSTTIGMTPWIWSVFAVIQSRMSPASTTWPFGAGVDMRDLLGRGGAGCVRDLSAGGERGRRIERAHLPPGVPRGEGEGVAELARASVPIGGAACGQQGTRGAAPLTTTA